MLVFIEKENKTVECNASSGKELLAKLNINPSTVLLVKNSDVILDEEPLSETDQIKILSVISGG